MLQGTFCLKTTALPRAMPGRCINLDHGCRAGSADGLFMAHWSHQLAGGSTPNPDTHQVMARDGSRISTGWLPPLGKVVISTSVAEAVVYSPPFCVCANRAPAVGVVWVAGAVVAMSVCVCAGIWAMVIVVASAPPSARVNIPPPGPPPGPQACAHADRAVRRCSDHCRRMWCQGEKTDLRFR